MKSVRLSMIALTLILSVGCKKDDKPPTLQAQRKQIIINGQWNLVYRGEDINKDGKYDIDSYEENYLAECQKDDTYVFVTDSSYTIEPNSNTNGCTDQVIHGTWKLLADGSTLTMDGLPGEIDSLTTNYLRYRLDIVDYSIYYILTK